ncbi:response regulator transcription factor [Micromonospora sp. BRA006-A]|nr:response regulator transcription factor [Micromonospora sp. BRA006-A]
MLNALARTAALTGDATLAADVSAVAAALPARYPAEHAHAAHVTAILGGTAPTGPADRARRVAGGRGGMAGGRAAVPAGPGAAGAGRGGRGGGRARRGGRRGTGDGRAGRPAGRHSLGEQAATLARRVGLRGTGRPGPDLLTSREQEVLRLVAEGHSNSRIAERLFISPKTASVHVSRIIAKLDVTNRVEAAALAHRLGLLDRPSPAPAQRRVR